MMMVEIYCELIIIFLPMDSPTSPNNQLQIHIPTNERTDTQSSPISQYQAMIPQQYPCAAKIQGLVVMLQKNIRANLKRVILKEEFKKINRRKRIIKELVDTEESYIRDLGFIVSDFKMRMQSRFILTAEEGRKLFSNVDEIRQLHDIFFSTLFNHFNNYHPYRIIFSDVLNCILFFRIYIEYLDNFPAACDLLEEYKTSKPGFASFVTEISKLPQYRFLSIEDYMVKPVQRLPKYVLLLKDLVKNTHQSHPDFQNVKKALQKFEQVNNNNNEKLNKIRNSFKLRQIESMLQLPQGIITPSTQFILEESVQILNLQNNNLICNCVVYLLNSTIIVARRLGNLLNRQTHLQASYHSSRISRASGILTSTMKQKLQAIVPLKYGTSIEVNKDQCFYKNSFTVQSAQGESCTFICANQEQLHNLFTKIKKQSDAVIEHVMSKLKSMFQSQNINHHSTFIKAISLLDKVPEVTVLGTSERSDKMLKYTVYIVEIKVKMIRQKIFLRFSELLDLENFIGAEYGGKITIKQGLVSSSWLNNHHQKTIEQRKMNIQRFLKEVLSKTEIMQNGLKILLRLGLPVDLYDLPDKLMENKNTESFIKRSSVVNKSMVKKKNLQQKSIWKNRMSLFHQQELEELQEQEEEDTNNEVQIKQMIKQSFHKENQNPKSSTGSTPQIQKTICIQDLLKANQVNLGHYTRMESLDISRSSLTPIDTTRSTTIDLQILVPSLSAIYDNPNRKNGKYMGFTVIKVQCWKLLRVQNIIALVAKQIPLQYYKDFRLLIEKQYYHRILDDDEQVLKIFAEINRTKSSIVFRKMIYVEHVIEERELINDKKRLEILGGQIINEIRMGKYRLNYENYLKFSVLSTIVYRECKDRTQSPTKQILEYFAKHSKKTIFPKYSSLSQTEDIWIRDFVKAYGIINQKLQQVAKTNQIEIEKQKQQNQAVFLEEQQKSDISSIVWPNTSIKYLALLSIVKEIQKNDNFYGCIEFPVQISQDFKNYIQSETGNEFENFDTYIPGPSIINRATSNEQVLKIQRKLSDEENKNCWLGIKHSKVIFTSITKGNLLLELTYDNISKIQTYSSAVFLGLRNMGINRIKLKTTSSYEIREMLLYYKNYGQILKKLFTNSDLIDSMICMAREEICSEKQEMDECFL